MYDLLVFLGVDKILAQTFHKNQQSFPYDLYKRVDMDMDYNRKVYMC